MNENKSIPEGVEYSVACSFAIYRLIINSGGCVVLNILLQWSVSTQSQPSRTAFDNTSHIEGYRQPRGTTRFFVASRREEGHTFHANLTPSCSSALSKFILYKGGVINWSLRVLSVSPHLRDVVGQVACATS